MKGTPSAVVVIVAIVAVVVLECVALNKGINGKLYGLAMGIIAALGGVHFDKLRKVLKGLIE